MESNQRIMSGGVRIDMDVGISCIASYAMLLAVPDSENVNLIFNY